MSEELLDVDLIARRRTELGMSQRALAAEAGLNPAAVSVLESGGNHAEFPLRSVKRLADALALPLRSLFRLEAADAREPTADDMLVEALLVRFGKGVQRQEIARVLGWDLARTADALDALRSRLEATGVVLHRASSGYMIRHRSDVLTDDELRELERLRLHTRQVREPAMRLLLRIMTRGLPKKWEQTAANGDRVALQMLVKSGLVTANEAGFVPTPALLKSLKLTAPRPSRHRAAPAALRA